MQKKRKTSQATLKSQSSLNQDDRGEVELPPLDELVISIKNLRFAGQDRRPHTVTITFFDQLLVYELITPIGAKDPEKDSHGRTHVSGTLNFEPSDYAKMCLFADNPLIDNDTESVVRESDSHLADYFNQLQDFKRIRIHLPDEIRLKGTSCCNIDILPLFQGQTTMYISKRMEPMMEPTALQQKSWDNLPLITMELTMIRDPQNKVHHEVLDAANFMKMTVIAAYNVLKPYDGSFEYQIASKIRLSNDNNASAETFKQSIRYPKRFSTTGFYPRWESVSWDDLFRKSDEKVSFSQNDIQNYDNINLNRYLNLKYHRNSVAWVSFHRSLLLPSDERLLAKQLRRYQWPIEFLMADEDGSYSFMGFMDLFTLLYPGETTIRVAVPLHWMDSWAMMEKCGCEPMLSSQEKTPRSTVASFPKDTAADGSAITNLTQQPPTGADGDAAFVIVEVTLARPLLQPVIPPYIPEPEIKKMLGKPKDEHFTCTGRGQLNEGWCDTVTTATELLRRIPHYGTTEFCTFNRQLSETRTRVELSSSFWQEAAIYVNNNFVVQDFAHSDETFEEMIMMAHACLVREASKILFGCEPEHSDPTLRAARHARQLQDIPHATELYLQLVTENQNNANSWRELANCMMDEDVDLARVCIDESLLLNPRHPLTLLSKASMLFQEDVEASELFFTAIMALYPFWSTGWVVAQAFYLERQEFFMADKIKQYLKEQTEDLASERGWEKELGDWWYSTPILPGVNPFLEAADLLLRLRGMPLAEVCLARALSMQGPTPAYAHLVALSCRLRGDVDNALCHLQGALETFGEVNYLRSLEAELLKKKRDSNAALMSYYKAGNCVNAYSILSALPGRDPQRARSVIVELLRRQPSAHAWMALADDWLMRQAAAGPFGGAGDAETEVAMSTCAAACAEQALRWDRRCARAWALLAQLSKPQARRDYCKTMAIAFGYKWPEEDVQLSGSKQSLCYRLGKALKECRCNLCETNNKSDCGHSECDCVNLLFGAVVMRWLVRIHRVLENKLEDVPPAEDIIFEPTPK